MKGVLPRVTFFGEAIGLDLHIICHGGWQRRDVALSAMAHVCGIVADFRAQIHPNGMRGPSRSSVTVRACTVGTACAAALSEA